jgi:hypothetical protein
MAPNRTIRFELTLCPNSPPDAHSRTSLMGADQSKPSTSEPSSGTQTPIVAGPGGNHYTLLGIDEGAGENEIKVSWSLSPSSACRR